MMKFAPSRSATTVLVSRQKITTYSIPSASNSIRRLINGLNSQLNQFPWWRFKNKKPEHVRDFIVRQVHAPQMEVPKPIWKSFNFAAECYLAVRGPLILLVAAKRAQTDKHL
jgi:hypothetical protein